MKRSILNRIIKRVGATALAVATAAVMLPYGGNVAKAAEGAVPLTNIALTLKEPVIGATAQDMPVTSSADYYVEIFSDEANGWKDWIQNKYVMGWSDSTGAHFAGTFQDGETYTYTFTINGLMTFEDETSIAHDITADTAVTVNGKAANVLEIYHYHEVFEDGFTIDVNYGYYSVTYSFGQETPAASDDTSSSNSASSGDASSNTTDKPKISVGQAAEYALAAASTPAASDVAVPAGSSVKINSVSAISDQAAIDALPAYIEMVQKATSLGVQKVYSFDLNASGSGQVTINVGQQYAGYVAVVGHYTGGQWRSQQVIVDANGVITPSFASFSPITVAITNKTSLIDTIATTEGSTVSAKTGENGLNPLAVAAPFVLIAAAEAIVLEKRRKRS